MRKACDLGESANATHVIGHTCTWLAWTCADTGRLDEAVTYADRAIALYDSGQTQDPYIYFNALAGKGYACWHRGERASTYAIGDRLIEFGHRHTNVRSLVLGHSSRGWSYLISGDIDRAEVSFEEAVRVSVDPWYARFPKLALGYGFTAAGAKDQAMPLLQELIEFSIANGAEFLGTTARFFHELIEMTPSNASEKLHFLEGQLEEWRQTTSWLRYVICGHLMARGFMRLSQADGEIKTPVQTGWKAYAMDKAEQWYKLCIDIAKDKGMALLQALSWMGLAECSIRLGKRQSAREAVTHGKALLEQCDAEHYLIQVRELLDHI
jgi:tetratricopeptide (TPR) repeat protein